MSQTEHDQLPDTFIETRTREQLSALIDGQLCGDELRFLQRRLAHDCDLRDCWSRWQGYGEVLRGQSTALREPGFAQRVMSALAAEQAAAEGAAAATGQATGTHGRRWLPKLGGAALAASVAMAGLFALRQPSPTSDAAPAEQLARTHAAPASLDSTIAAGVARPMPEPPAPVTESGSAGIAAAAAVAAAARPARARGNQRTRNEAAPRQVAARVVEPAARQSEPVAAQPQQTVASNDTRVAAAAEPPATPSRWPRAVLPALQDPAFNARYLHAAPAEETPAPQYAFPPPTMEQVSAAD